MKRPVAIESASAFIDEKIKELGDGRGKMPAKVRKIIGEETLRSSKSGSGSSRHRRDLPVFSHGGIFRTGETYNNLVKMTFA